MTHFIVWEFDRDTTRSTAVCEDDECLNRYACDDNCEIVWDVRREADKTVTHGMSPEDGYAAFSRHSMHKLNECNVVEFLTADRWAIPEMHDGSDRFEIGRTAFEPVWNGEDSLMWKRIVPASTTGSEQA